MSNQDTITITSNPNGIFEVSSEKSDKTHHARIMNRSGCDVVEFHDPEQESEFKNPPHPRSSFQFEPATVQVDGLGQVKKLGVMTSQPPTHNADSRHVVGTLQDLKGAPCGDVRAATANPEGYTVSIGGIRTSLANAMRLGMVGVSGTGDVYENLENIMEARNPNDPSLPGADRKRNRESDLVDFKEPAIVLLDAMIEQTGLDRDDLYAKALAGNSSAGRELANVLGGNITPEECTDLLFGAVQVRMTSVATAFERAAHLPEGEGMKVVDWVFNHMSKAQGMRIAHGLMAGHIPSMKEALEAYASGSNY